MLYLYGSFEAMMFDGVSNVAASFRIQKRKADYGFIRKERLNLFHIVIQFCRNVSTKEVIGCGRKRISKRRIAKIRVHITHFFPIGYHIEETLGGNRSGH